MTERDPNETARMPIPGDAGTPPTEGWPGSTAVPDEAPPPDPFAAEASLPSDRAAPYEGSTSEPEAEPAPAEPIVAAETGLAPDPDLAAEPGLALEPVVTPEPGVDGAPDPAGWYVPPSEATKPRREEPDHGRAASVVFGLILLAIGLWFFIEQTLGLELPPIRWSQFWPVILIGLGVWIVLGSMRRGSR